MTCCGLSYRNLAQGCASRCFIELGTKKVSKEQMALVEDKCNDLIRQGVAMTPRWCEPGSPEMEQVSGERGGAGVSGCGCRYDHGDFLMTLKGRVFVWWR